MYLYTRKHKYRHLQPVFLIINNHCEFTAHTRKFTWLFLIEKPVLNAVFKLSGIQNQISIRFGTKNAIKTYLKAKNALPPHTHF